MYCSAENGGNSSEPSSEKWRIPGISFTSEPSFVYHKILGTGKPEAEQLMAVPVVLRKYTLSGGSMMNIGPSKSIRYAHERGR